jgi:signal peptidase II
MFVLAAAIVATISCDRVTKHVAAENLAGTSDRSYLSDTVRLTYAENTGAFLGLGADLPPVARTLLFTVGTGAMLLAVAVVAFRSRWAPGSRIGAALFLAGGASNWIDRVIHGSVVDFLNVGIGPVRTGVFNVADVAIMLGACLIAWTELRRREAPDETPPAVMSSEPS